MFLAFGFITFGFNTFKPFHTICIMLFHKNITDDLKYIPSNSTIPYVDCHISTLPYIRQTY